MWSAGCIFAEMLSGQPLFAGTSEIDQIKTIFRYAMLAMFEQLDFTIVCVSILGTPNEQTWPSIKNAPDMRMHFTSCDARPISELLPGVDPFAADLLLVTSTSLLFFYVDDFFAENVEI
jgi:hypothetical protein